MSAKALEGGPPVELTDRKKKILRAVVESYIQTAEPVGSKALAELAELKVSSATIPVAIWSSPTPPPDGFPPRKATGCTSTS